MSDGSNNRTDSMVPELWQRIKLILADAMEKDPSERQSFVADACADDQALRQEVVSLLEISGHLEGFIEVPVMDLLGHRTNGKAIRC